MTTIDDIRTRIRQDLHDTDSAAYRWPDDQLDRHITHALDELSRAIPLELTATIATTSGSADLSLSALTGLIEVERVEYPVGHFPRCYVPFGRWADTLTMIVETLPTGDDAQLSYTARQTLDASGTTLAGFLEDLVVMGGAAYAVLEQGVATVDLVTTGVGVPERFEAGARARLTAFHQLLFQHGRNNRVRTRQLRRPA
jgi:hypothetical protein